MCYNLIFYNYNIKLKIQQLSKTCYNININIMKKNNKKDYWKTKSGHALIDVGKWLFIYGLISFIVSGVSLVYGEIYTLNQRVNQAGLATAGGFLAICIFGPMFLSSLYFIFRGISILQKKRSIEKTGKKLFFAILLLFLLLIPNGIMSYSSRGFNLIFFVFLILVTVDLITVFYIFRFAWRRADEKQKTLKKSKKTEYYDDSL